jgi:hypothetical protein
LTLSVSGTSTLVGGANINGTTNTNNLNVINNSNFSQTGSGTFSTGTGAVTLNGGVICSSTSSFTGLATFNGNILLPSGKSLTLPSTRVINATNDVVDTANSQTVSGQKTFSSQIIANGGINAGSNSITCGSLTCSSENDTGALTVTGTLNANGGIVTNGANINAGIGSITCGSLTCSSENDTGALTVTGALNANGGIVTNNAGINAGSGTLQAGSIKSQVVSGTYTGVNSYFFTNGDVYGTTYFDNPQANSSINLRIGTSLPTIATVNTSGLSINGTITSNNNNINAGTGTITCGSLTCSSETDTGTLTVGGLLTANNGISIANNKSISTGDTGGALLFTGLGFSSTYAPTTGYGLGLTMNQNLNGEVSLFSLRNNPANIGGFSFYDCYTTTPTKTLLATLNSSAGLTTNNLPINTGTGSITLTGQINANGGIVTNNAGINAGLGYVYGVFSPMNSSGTISGTTLNTIIYTSPANHNFVVGSTEVFRITSSGLSGTGAITSGSLGVSKNTTGAGTYNTLASFYDSNTSLGSQPQIAVGNSSSLSNIFGYSYVGSASPYGFLGLAGAGSNQLCYDSNGFYIGSVQKPPNSGTYKLQVDGPTNINGDITLGNTNKIIFPNINANNYIASGPADGVSSTAYDLKIGCWYGLGFVYSNTGAGANTSQTASIYFDCRVGQGNFGSISTYAGTVSTNGSASGTITSAGLITANGGLTIPSGQTLTANGGITTANMSLFSASIVL